MDVDKTRTVPQRVMNCGLSLWTYSGVDMGDMYRSCGFMQPPHFYWTLDTIYTPFWGLAGITWANGGA